MSNISQRDAFWVQVYNIAKEDRNVVVVSADMGSPSLDKFRLDLPAQFINVGIAEQNAILIASGLSLTGKKVFVYAIAPFITLRCLEQIRVENAIMNNPITLVGVGAGFGYEDSGPTHHIIEDIAIMRALPRIQINSITDNIMASAFATLSYKMETTNYIRLERQVLPEIYDKNTDFSNGFSVLKESKDCYIVSTGCMTHSALKIAKSLEREKINIGVIDLFTFPINGFLLSEIIKGVKKLITLEEHFLPGGLGSSICEITADNNILVPVKRLGLSTEKLYCYRYGGREIIRNYYGLDYKNIEDQIRTFILK